MSAVSKTEEVLRDIHVLFSQARPHTDGTSVVVNKKAAMKLIKKLTNCMYEMQEEYELNDSAMQKSKRELKKAGDDIIFEATRKAEDVYAASLMYTDSSLDDVKDIINKTSKQIEGIFDEMKKSIETQYSKVSADQAELKSELGTMIESGKYLSLIDEANSRKEKDGKTFKVDSSVDDDYYYDDDNPYKNIIPEIKINESYLLQNYGTTSIDEITGAKYSAGMQERKEDSDNAFSSYAADDDGEIDPILSAQLDNDYFDNLNNIDGSDVEDIKIQTSYQDTEEGASIIDLATVQAGVKAIAEQMSERRKKNKSDSNSDNKSENTKASRSKSKKNKDNETKEPDPEYEGDDSSVSDSDSKSLGVLDKLSEARFNTVALDDSFEEQIEYKMDESYVPETAEDEEEDFDELDNDIEAAEEEDFEDFEEEYEYEEDELDEEYEYEEDEDEEYEYEYEEDELDEEYEYEEDELDEEYEYEEDELDEEYEYEEDELDEEYEYEEDELDEEYEYEEDELDEEEQEDETEAVATRAYSELTQPMFKASDIQSTVTSEQLEKSIVKNSSATVSASYVGPVDTGQSEDDYYDWLYGGLHPELDGGAKVDNNTSSRKKAQEAEALQEDKVKEASDQNSEEKAKDNEEPKAAEDKTEDNIEDKTENKIEDKAEDKSEEAKAEEEKTTKTTRAKSAASKSPAKKTTTRKTATKSTTPKSKTTKTVTRKVVTKKAGTTKPAATKAVATKAVTTARSVNM